LAGFVGNSFLALAGNIVHLVGVRRTPVGGTEDHLAGGNVVAAGLRSSLGSTLRRLGVYIYIILRMINFTVKRQEAMLWEEECVVERK